MQDVEQFIRKHVRRILSEATVIRGRVGPGSWDAVSKMAGSLADKDPEGFIKKLGAEGFTPAGPGPEEKVLSFLRAVMTGPKASPVMREAYGNPELAVDEGGKKIILLKHHEELLPRTAVQYAFLALSAAAAAGRLSGLTGRVIPGLVSGRAAVIVEPSEEVQSGRQDQTLQDAESPSTRSPAKGDA